MVCSRFIDKKIPTSIIYIFEVVLSVNHLGDEESMQLVDCTFHESITKYKF
jgi:hypothetical protein